MGAYKMTDEPTTATEKFCQEVLILAKERGMMACVIGVIHHPIEDAPAGAEPGSACSYEFSTSPNECLCIIQYMNNGLAPRLYDMFLEQQGGDKDETPN